MRLIKRQKILLALLQQFNGRSEREIQLLLFIYCNEFANDNYYDFIPQKSGPVSLTAIADINSFLKNDVGFQDEDYMHELDLFEQVAFQGLKEEWLDEDEESISHYMENSYAEYFELPEIRELNDETLFTIGYEGRSIEAYLNELLENDIRLLCDVRANAYSHKYGFSKAELKAALTKINIEYIHIPELGIASEKRKNTDSEDAHIWLFRDYDSEIWEKQAE